MAGHGGHYYDALWVNGASVADVRRLKHLSELIGRKMTTSRYHFEAIVEQLRDQYDPHSERHRLLHEILTLLHAHAHDAIEDAIEGYGGTVSERRYVPAHPDELLRDFVMGLNTYVPRQRRNETRSTMVRRLPQLAGALCG